MANKHTTRDTNPDPITESNSYTCTNPDPQSNAKSCTNTNSHTGTGPDTNPNSQPDTRTCRKYYPSFNTG